MTMRFLGQLLTWRRVDTIGDARRSHCPAVLAQCASRQWRGERTLRRPDGDQQGGRCKFEAAHLARRVANGLASSTHIYVVMHLSGVAGRIEDENVERIRPNVPFF